MDPKWTSGNELKYLKQVLDNAKEVRDNAFTDRLETAFKKKYKVKYAIALNSGTDALTFALALSGIRRGDEVITTPNSFIATAAAIVHLGAKPVFVDVGEDLNIDPTLIKEKINSRTKAIVPMHYAGHMCKMNEILKIAGKIFDLDVREQDVTIEELMNADEVFFTGTAVVVAPVGSICYNDKTVNFEISYSESMTKNIREESR